MITTTFIATTLFPLSVMNAVLFILMFDKWCKISFSNTCRLCIVFWCMGVEALSYCFAHTCLTLDAVEIGFMLSTWMALFGLTAFSYFCIKNTFV